MGFDVWFRDDVSRAVQALHLVAEACQDMPTYVLRDQEVAYRQGWQAGFDAALLAVSTAFGVDGLSCKGREVIVCNAEHRE